MEQIAISKIKTNKENPRKIDKKRMDKLMKSIQEFPQMLEQRPIIIDENNVALGGNMRLQACKKLKMKTVPVSRVTGWTEDQKKEFVVKDNMSYGEWDWTELTAGWGENKLGTWGLIQPMTREILEKPEITDTEFNTEIEQLNDQNAELPIVPEFHEKYAYFIILTKNEIDEEFIRNIFNLTGKTSSHKSTDNRRSNVIQFEKFQEEWLKQKS